LTDDSIRVETFQVPVVLSRTDTGVRLTHLPTGTVVECQDERSQHKNKAKAMRLLREALVAPEVAETPHKAGESL